MMELSAATDSVVDRAIAHLSGHLLDLRGEVLYREAARRLRRFLEVDLVLVLQHDPLHPDHPVTLAWSAADPVLPPPRTG